MNAKKKIILDDLKKQQVFTVPEGYFDTLPQQIQQKVTTTEKQALPLVNWLNVIRYSFATLLVVMILGYLFYPNLDSTQTTTQILSNIPDDEIINYLGNVSEVSQQDWIEAASKVNTNLEIPAFPNLPISEEVVVEEVDPYLLEDSY